MLHNWRGGGGGNVERDVENMIVYVVKNGIVS